MKVDFKSVLMNLKGEPIKSSQDPTSPDATLGDVAMMALLNAEAADNLTRKLECFRLAQAIERGDQDITPEQASLLKEKIGAMQGPLVCGRCAELLNG